MTPEQIHEIVRNSNPIPDLDVLDPIAPPALASGERTKTMSTKALNRSGPGIESQPMPTPSKPLPVWVAAVVAVVMAGGVLLLATSNELNPMAGSTMTFEEAEEMVVALFDASAEGDVNGFRSHVAPHPNLPTGFTLDDAIGEFVWFNATGSRLELIECAEGLSSDAFVEVLCRAQFRSQIREGLGLDPAMAQVTSHVTPQGIVMHRVAYPDDNWSAPERQFASWLRLSYPADAHIGLPYPFPDPEDASELGALRQLYVAEWLDLLEETGCYWNSGCLESAIRP